MQERKKDMIWSLALITITVIACIYSTGSGKIFGAKVDWSSQHSVFPEYFRQQFYQTGSLFPEFALNLGGGQNIYNFSYYGLYSPVVLVGYLFPNIKMSDYLMVASIVCLAAGVVILYLWFRSRKFSYSVSGMTALMFLFAGPMIYQSSHQIMFVNYMPFLCLAFWGIDRYFEKNRLGMLIGSVFLMIMTSFYFSIGGLLALGLYGIYRYARTKERMNEAISGKGLLKDGLDFCIIMGTGILLSGILLVPTALALFGRSGKSSGEKINLVQLLISHIDLKKFFYGAYGPGLGCLVMIVLLTGLFYKKAYEKILSLGCLVVLTVPIFSYLLNGALYIRPKVLIPFLPLLCYLTAKYLEKLREQKVSRVWIILPCLAVLIYIYLNKNDLSDKNQWKLMLANVCITGVICVGQVYSRWMRQHLTILIMGPVILCLIVTEIYSWQQKGNLESVREYEKTTDKEIGKAIKDVLESDDGFYRIEQIGNDEENAGNLNRIWDSNQYITSVYSSSYNSEYQDFRKNSFQLEQPYRNFLMQSVSQNPIFRQLMGVKYLISKKDVAGYEWKKTSNGVKIYCNKNAAPIAYETDQTISEREYEKLEFPYNQLVFTQYAVAGEGKVTASEVQSELGAEIEKIPFCIGNEDGIETTDSGYQIKLKKGRTVSIPLTNIGTEDTILFLQFQINNHKPEKDVEISLEGERNKLSSIDHVYYNDNTVFTYAVSVKKGQQNVQINLGKGDYEIKNIKAYLEKTEQKVSLYQSVFRAEKVKTKGNCIQGTITNKEAGYFVTSIPYDKGFSVYVDGKETKYTKVNKAFLGFKMSEGEHDIKIIYHAPGGFAGKCATGLGVIMMLIIMKKRKRGIKKVPSAG